MTDYHKNDLELTYNSIPLSTNIELNGETKKEEEEDNKCGKK